MGEEIMINKLEINVDLDYGTGNPEDVVRLEKDNGIKLPSEYVEFILRHNGADINTEAFEFDNPYNPVNNGSAIFFLK